MGSVGPALLVQHLLSVAMISCHEEHGVVCFTGRIDCSDRLVYVWFGMVWYFEIIRN